MAVSCSVSSCPACGALVNPRWRECIACHEPLGGERTNVSPLPSERPGDVNTSPDKAPIIPTTKAAGRVALSVAMRDWLLGDPPAGIEASADWELWRHLRRIVEPATNVVLMPKLQHELDQLFARWSPGSPID